MRFCISFYFPIKHKIGITRNLKIHIKKFIFHFTFSHVSSTHLEPQDYWNRNSNVFNEYVVYDDKQVAVRYILKLSSADQGRSVVEDKEQSDEGSICSENSDEVEEETDEENGHTDEESGQTY